MSTRKKSIVLMLVGSALLSLPLAFAESIQVDPLLLQMRNQTAQRIAAKLAQNKIANKLKLENAINAPEVNAAVSGLKNTLDGLGYDDAVKKLMSDAYKHGSIFDDDFQKQLPNLNASEKEVLALRFFMFGAQVPVDTAKKVLFSSPEGIKTLQALKDAGLVNETLKSLSMNRVSVLSYSLGSEKMYILSDQPESVSHEKGASGEVSTTSHQLLAKVESLKPGTIKGVGADFGSGVGIQAIALLKTQPLKKVYAAEVDQHSMNLSRLNAKLNDVESRFEVIDNSDPARLTQALGSEKLEIAVSNPPFNIVPEALAKEFDAYGGGGPEGLTVTKIFLAQVKQNLKTNGDFVFYSQLARDKKGSYAVEKYIRDILGDGFSVEIVECDDPKHALSQKVYASALANYMKNDMGSKRSVSQLASITKASLVKYNVDEVVPAIVNIRRTGATPTAFSKTKSLECTTSEFAKTLLPNQSVGPTDAAAEKVADSVDQKNSSTKAVPPRQTATPAAERKVE